MATLSKTVKTQELLTKEASSMEELINNAIKMEQLLHDTSTTDTLSTNNPGNETTINPGNETLILVMISSMKQIVDCPKPTSFSINDTLTKNIIHTTREVQQYKYASNLNRLKWATKALKTKTDVNLQHTQIPRESVSPPIWEESNISFTKFKRQYDPTNSINVISLPMSTNGE